MEHVLQPSRRAVGNLQSGAFIDLEDEVSKLPSYDPQTCPSGLINLSGAVNNLMGDHMRQCVSDFAAHYELPNAKYSSSATRYGGVIGPEELSRAVASFVNRHFLPASPVSPDMILSTNGVSSLIDLLSFNVCDTGEGVMVITPTYMMFPHDLCAKTGVQLIKADLSDMEAQFSAAGADQLVVALKRAYEAARAQGIPVRALLICNPCNPMGRSYSRKSLVAVAQFCGQRAMHLLADEIYAMSSFDSGEGLDTFTSVLSLEDDPESSIYKENKHSMYGASKDFGAGGLRLGFLITRNELLWKTCRRLALFTWVTCFSTALFTRLLEDVQRVDMFISVYQERLRKAHDFATRTLRKHGIPFFPANSGLFLLLNLSEWLSYFNDSNTNESQEAKLCRYLAFKAGVFLNMGELSLSPISGCFRIVYATNPEVVELSVARLAVALKTLETKHVNETRRE
ncbi:PLP-dependent transferase [Thozetella sp. PMI_491]|nr:PLP-dependent transferase [Thozetella sp. PMI_491]